MHIQSKVLNLYTFFILAIVLYQKLRIHHYNHNDEVMKYENNYYDINNTCLFIDNRARLC